MVDLYCLHLLAPGRHYMVLRRVNTRSDESLQPIVLCSSLHRQVDDRCARNSHDIDACRGCEITEARVEHMAADETERSSSNIGCRCKS